MLGLAPILGVIAPVFACAALGFFWARTGRAYDRASITELISSVGAPCLVFHNLVGLAADPEILVAMSGAALLSVLACLILAYLVLRGLRLPAHTYLSPLVFGNAGNLGLAVSSFAFPARDSGEPAGLAFAVCFFAVASFLHFTLGVMLWAGRFSVQRLLRTPLAWAAIGAAAVVALGIPVPGWIMDTTELLGAFSIPLMLLTLGVALSELEIRSLPQSVLLSLVRLGMGAGVGFALAEVLAFEGVARGVLVIECAMPSAVFNVLFAEQYDRSPAQVASLVVVSTALSFLTLPFLLAAVM